MGCGWGCLHVTPLRPIERSALYLGHMAWRPPSTGIDAPVMNDESSEARNAMVRATSSGWPGLPNACVSLLRSRNWKHGNVNVIVEP